MQFPVYLRIGPVSLHPHWVLESLAYVLAFRLYLSIRRKRGDAVDESARWRLIAAAAIGAAIGSKVLSWVEDPMGTWTHLRDAAFMLGGKTIIGGIIGGTVAVEWAKKRLGIHSRTGDLFALPLVLGMAVGRVGCFLTGLEDKTFGLFTGLPWGVDFGDGPRHPTQLYEIVFLIVLGGFLWRLEQRPHRAGRLFQLFLASYMAFRLAVDFVKPEVRVMAGLSSLQWVCVLTLGYVAIDLFRELRTPVAGQATQMSGGF
jgi:prolipoprotein diacylglyceryltransferase